MASRTVPYADTKVSVDKSKTQIGELLRKRGIMHVQWTEEPDPKTLRPVHTLRFRAVTLDKIELRVRMTVRTPAAKRVVYSRTSAKSDRARQEQEERRVMRVFAHHIKTLFEAADIGLQRVEEVFLAHLEDVGGVTVGEALRPMIPQLTMRHLPRAALAAGSET